MKIFVAFILTGFLLSQSGILLAENLDKQFEQKVQEDKTTDVIALKRAAALLEAEHPEIAVRLKKIAADKERELGDTPVLDF